jgi:hypothetical protein
LLINRAATSGCRFYSRKNNRLQNSSAAGDHSAVGRATLPSFHNTRFHREDTQVAEKFVNNNDQRLNGFVIVAPLRCL